MIVNCKLCFPVNGVPEQSPCIQLNFCTFVFDWHSKHNNRNLWLLFRSFVDFMAAVWVASPAALWTRLRTIPLFSTFFPPRFFFFVSAFFGKRASGTICSTMGCNFTHRCTFALKLLLFRPQHPYLPPYFSVVPRWRPRVTALQQNKRRDN